MVHEKNWRVNLCVQELYHPRDFLSILAAGLRFYLALDFGWIGQRVSLFFPFNMFT